MNPNSPADIVTGYELDGRDSILCRGMDIFLSISSRRVLALTNLVSNGYRGLFLPE
jgi:hypothetical protein